MSLAPLAGCLTALVTPFDATGGVDPDGLSRLLDFQRAGGVDGVVGVGTTGESPTLSLAERRTVVETIRDRMPAGSRVVVGTGSNSTESALRATRDAAEAGAGYALVVDPYYNGPSSLEIRREYYEPIARAFPTMGIVPYVIPGRTGTRIEPFDLGELTARCPNVLAVKDAAGSVAFSRSLRRFLRPGVTILAGDDARTDEMARDPGIRSEGVISCLSNIFPGTVARSVAARRSGGPEPPGLARQARALQPLFELVTVETEEGEPGSSRRIRARNPVPLKAMMRILGLPAGRCRPPLGRLTPAGLARVLDALRRSFADCPELFDEVEAAFGVSVADRLEDPRSWEGIAYAD